MRIDDTMIGIPVVDANGDQLGRVKEVGNGCFKVDAPMAFDYWLSDTCIDSTSDGMLLLNVDHGHLGEYKLDGPTGMIHNDDRIGTTGLGTTHTGDLRTDRDVVGTTGVDHDTVRLHEERLHATTQPVQAGEVRIGKEIVSEERSVDVPVSHEEVVIERHSIDGTPRPGELHDMHTDQEIRVPVMEEHVQVEKHVVPTEEISVGKREVHEIQRVTDTVHHEEARLEHSGDIPVHGWDTVRTGYQQRWQDRYGTTGGRWEEMEPSYRYGWEMRNDPRYRGRRFSEVEPELRHDYGDWSSRSGFSYDDSLWDRNRLGIEDAFDDTTLDRAA